LKVVLDSSVWISALKFGGLPRRAAARAASDDEIVVCPYIESEIHAALTKKFRWTDAEVRQGLANYLDNAIWVTTTGALTGICRDPADDPIIECAILANATIIVAGDHDLLALKSYSRVRIVTARQYLEHADAAAT